MKNNAARKKILCIDDDEIFLEMVKNILEKDYLIETVNSGESALDYLSKNECPDLILLDIIMPKMDGWETLNKIRLVTFRKDIPIIFITSDTTTREKAKAMSGVDYITKPIDGKDLARRINIVLKN